MLPPTGPDKRENAGIPPGRAEWSHDRRVAHTAGLVRRPPARRRRRTPPRRLAAGRLAAGGAVRAGRRRHRGRRRAVRRARRRPGDRPGLGDGPARQPARRGASAAGLWTRGVPWPGPLPAAVETGDLPDRAWLDAWADRHTLGLIKRFPVTVGPDVVLLLATALATKVSWEAPFDLSTRRPAGRLGCRAGPGHAGGRVLPRVVRRHHPRRGRGRAHRPRPRGPRRHLRGGGAGRAGGRRDRGRVRHRRRAPALTVRPAARRGSAVDDHRTADPDDRAGRARGEVYGRAPGLVRRQRPRPRAARAGAAGRGPGGRRGARPGRVRLRGPPVRRREVHAGRLRGGGGVRRWRWRPGTRSRATASSGRRSCASATRTPWWPPPGTSAGSPAAAPWSGRGTACRSSPPGSPRRTRPSP